MRFSSTNNISKGFRFRDAVMAGLAPDGGLFMPEAWPKLPKHFFQGLARHSFQKIAFDAASLYVKEIPKPALKKIIRDAFTFPAPVVPLEDGIYLLELFHGPTMAFKDFGARFLSRVASYFLTEAGREMTIIVATSGDTGSAVASGFHGVQNVRVFILYPSGKVSPLQEKQLTTYGGNVTAVEIRGTFDDCQRLAKAALSDPELVETLSLSSANSINFGRLLPQSFYYLAAAGTLRKRGVTEPPVFVVPSGNFGNGFAGLLAKTMGLPARFLFATNENDIVPSYLKTGRFAPRKSKKTISNAMDVGSPSNFARILALYKTRARMQKDITATSVSDRETRKTIKDVYDTTGYVLDPHTAVGVSAARRYQKAHGVKDPLVVLATAHPAKFREIVEPVIGKRIPLPPELQAPMRKRKKSIVLPADFKRLKLYLLTSLTN